ncbi:MAG: hypothetical protein D6746_16000 [Bacteroidetes bacterium]|nr:MAG: hypothetical protein D6746_16000 [Bacteroidota bacterium]
MNYSHLNQLVYRHSHLLRRQVVIQEPVCIFFVKTNLNSFLYKLVLVNKWIVFQLPIHCYRLCFSSFFVEIKIFYLNFYIIIFSQ